MPTVFDYLDYRTYLRDFYEQQKQSTSFFSYRYMAAKIGCDAGFLVKVLQGKLHLNPKVVPSTIALLKLEGKEADYFRELVAFSKAENEKAVSAGFERLMSLKGVSKRCVEEHQYEFYQKWYYSAVRALLKYYRFAGDFKKLAKKLSPAITVPEARAAVDLLERLGLIRRDDHGVYQLTDAFITTGEKWRSAAVKAYQRETMHLAQESLDRHAKEVRDISTVTVTVARKDIPALRERIAQFRSDLMSIAQNTEKHDAVYQVNVQVFPLTETEEAS